MKRPALDFETLAAQAGMRVRVGDVISTAPPIDASTTFTYDSVDEVHAALSPDGAGYAYARNGNPTVVGLEQAVARLEGAEDAVAFASGMAAIHATLTGLGLEAGDEIVAATDLYGVTRSLLLQLSAFDIHTHFVDVLDREAVDRRLAESHARLLYFESISNPLLRVADVAALVEMGHRHRALVVLDNTFATPYIFRPVECGVDLVLHSATKYIAGHGDAVAGLVAGKRSLLRRVRDTRTASGGILSPFEAWLTMRGVRTLPVRLDRQCASAQLLAEWLAGQRWIERVYYPGLAEHPQHATAARQFGGRFGGVVAFDLRAGQTETLRFLDALELITPGTSLGDVESLVLYPPLSSHRTLTPDQLRAYGIGEGLVRLSVGLESPHDLMADLEGAARRAGLVPSATTGEPA